MQTHVTVDASAKASKQIGCALACADRHIGPCTTSIALNTQAVLDSLVNLLGQSRSSPSPFILPNVVSLDLVLCNEGSTKDDSIRQFASLLLQRLPNLIAARLRYCSVISEATLVPLPQLKHLDLCMYNLDILGRIPFGRVVPALETLCMTYPEDNGLVSELDFSGCQHLVQLRLTGLNVCRLSMPPHCRLRVGLIMGDSEFYADTSKAQQALHNVKEILVKSYELFSPQGLFARVRPPELEVIRCDWSDNWAGHDLDEDDVHEGGGIPSHALVHCLKHNRDLPALKSILCGDYNNLHKLPMKLHIPAGLAGVQEIMIATQRTLMLAFDNASSAGESLNIFYAVAAEVRVDTAAVLDMTNALFRRGLTLSMAQAGPEHQHAPSQCLYVRAFGALPLSYDDAISAVNARIEKWGRKNHDCAQCGVCFKCLRKAGVLESTDMHGKCCCGR